ncbi:MAG: LLM class flavin-dependent oxidoreductase [Dehalococcoidia bacterium]
MSRILTCTWAPTAIAGPKLTRGDVRESALATVTGPDLVSRLATPVERAEWLGIDHLLVAQRWWGTGEEIEASSFDCLAMTAYYAAMTSRIRLVTAIHPGFFLPAAIAKWGATLDRVTGGRWAINVTSGWHEQEFGMFGAALVPHDERYARSREFIEVLRSAWAGDEVDYRGDYYQVDGLRLEPRPSHPLTVFQGGQSGAAQDLAAGHSDWMFLNGGPPEKVEAIIQSVRDKAAARGRTVRCALYGIPLCRETDREAEDAVASMVANIDPDRVARRRERVSGAQGMWQESPDPLTTLDSNEGFASRLIGSPATIERRMLEFHDLGVDMFHLTLNDERFVAEVLPRIQAHR